MGPLARELQGQWPSLRREVDGNQALLSVSGPWLPPRWLTSFPAPSWPFWEDRLGPTMCYFIRSTLSTSHALETLEFSQEQAESNPIWSRKQGSVLGLGVIPMVTSEEGV